MRILYIHQYFATPEQGGITRSYEFSKHFISQGHEVIMITSHNNKKYKVENIEGIEVHWIPNYFDNSLSIPGRISSYFKFAFKSLWVSMSIKKIDIMYATSTPLTIGITAMILKIFKRKPYVFEVRDLWPEFPIQMGAIKSKLLQKIAYSLEKNIYKYSESIIALSPGMRDGVIKYNLNKEVSIIPNSSDLDIFYPREIDSNIAEKYKLNRNFNIIHFGSMGIANGLSYIIETAKIAQEKSVDVSFIFIGGGKTESELKELSKKYGLRNVKLLGFLPKHEVSKIVNACDISITSFLDLPILYTNSPNKLFDSLAAGKVCIVNSNGWTRDLVEDNNCGYYVDPNNPEDFLEKIIQIKENPELKKEMEKNARKLAISQFDRKKLSPRILKQLLEAI